MRYSRYLCRYAVVCLVSAIVEPVVDAAENDTAAPVQTLSQAVAWLEGEAHRIIRASRREMHDGTSVFPPQAGIGYDAFWLRDFEYTLEGSAESYSDDELLNACRLFLSSLDENGAGVDCIRFDGTPIYKPGFGSLGDNPVADGGPFTVAVAWHTLQRIPDKALARELLVPLRRTMAAVPRNPRSKLVHITPDVAWDRCAYGFTDTIRKQGDVLFCSLLYVQAARQMADICRMGGQLDEVDRWRIESQQVAASVRQVFWDNELGLFRAATVRCREHDIWGSAFAVYLGVADARQSRRVANYFRTHYAEIVQHGQVRHLPGGVYWELGRERDVYQNGAYWATPTGWFVYTLDLVDPELADRTIVEMVRYFQQYGACEWVIGERRQLPRYLASASLPLAGIRAMLARRTE